MSKKITIKDIAKEAGVSPALVSFAMSNAQCSGSRHYSVNEETARRILEIAEKHNFKPNIAARNLRLKRSHTIGVILSDISNSFFSNIARHIEDEANSAGYLALFGSTDEKPEKFKSLVDLMIDRDVDGIIAVPCLGCEDTLVRIRKSEFPTVLIDRWYEDFPRVILDNRLASSMAVSHLLAKGHRRIEMFSYDMRIPNIKQRETGYIGAMMENGLGDYVNLNYVNYDSLQEDINRIMSSIDFSKVDAAIFAANSIALAGLYYFSGVGISVPGDVDVVTYDENDAFKLMSSQITYIRQPIDEFAARSFEMIVDIIEKKETACTNVILAPELI